MNTPKEQQSQNKENECSDTWIFFQELEASPWQPSNLGEYKQLSLWKSIPMHSESSNTTSQISPSTQTSETTIQSEESLKLSQWNGRVREHQTQEVSKDYPIQPHHSGEKDLDALSKLDPSSVLWNSLKDLSDGDLELFLPPSIWQDTVLRLKQSRQQALGQDNKGTDCLSFPTLTSNECSTSRPAGQTKCEKWFKDNGLIPSGYQLGTRALALVMGFPSNWFEGLTEQYSKNLNIPNQPKPQEESEPDIWQVEQLHQPKHRSPSEEFSISIPCLVKQPDRPELRGVIQKDLGDHFLINVADKEITVSKLFVYPDFDKSAGTLQGGLNKSSSKNNANSHKKVSDTSDKCSSKIIPPCTKTNKQRRQKGEGSGHIYYRTVTRNGKDYQQAYYQWRENGKQKTKYIPKKLLKNIEDAEAQKLPVTEILDLLQGGLDKCSSKSSDTFSEREILTKDESVKTTANCSSKIDNPPCKRRKRSSGYGGGYIEYREVKRNHKVYAQYWYHWEIWRKGDRIEKKSKYIPKNKRSRVEKMNNEKIPVNKILEVLQLSR